jgi:hypothetical protein
MQVHQAGFQQGKKGCSRANSLPKEANRASCVKSKDLGVVL